MAEKSSDLKKKAVCEDDSNSQENAKNDFALTFFKLNLGPRKKLLILSLGGLLCYRINRICKKISSTSINRRPDAAYGNYIVYKRPYCTDFMKYCLARFEVGIWTSAKEWNMNNVLDCIMTKLRSKLLFAWDQDKCTASGFKTMENKHKPIFLKELKKIWDLSILSNRWEKFSSSNTLLIDTDPYKALLNPPHTAVFPTEYEASLVNDNALGPEGELRLFLDGLVDAEDVPSYVKGHPFGQPAITPMHPDWDYYSKIVGNHGKY